MGKPTKIENNITPIIMTPMKGGERPPAPFSPPSKRPQNEKISGKNTFIKTAASMTTYTGKN